MGLDGKQAVDTLLRLAGGRVSDRPEPPSGATGVRVLEAGPIAAQPASATFVSAGMTHAAFEHYRSLRSDHSVVGSCFIEGGLVHLTRPGRDRVQALWCPDERLRRLLRVEGGGGPLTASELRLIKRLVCGQTLRQAARLDGVAYETRRSQYKTAAAKLGVSSQGELLARILPDLFREEPTAGGTMDRRLLDDHFADARHHQLAAGRGGVHEYLEFGPSNGRPVLVFPTQALVPLGTPEIEELHRSGTRLFYIVRRGMLAADRGPPEPDEDGARNGEAVELLRSLLGLTQVDLFGFVSGGHHAYRYALDHPDRVASLALFGVVPALGAWSNASAFRHACIALVAQRPRIANVMFAHLERRLASPVAARTFLERLYAGSAVDEAALAELFDADAQIPWIVTAFARSRSSIQADFRTVARTRWEGLSGLAAPKLLLGGEGDRLAPPASMAAFAARHGASMVSLRDCGQLALGARGARVLRAHGEWLRSAQRPA